ncbi:conjugal transfer protein [Priestia sp. SB1]|uniref:conjugal transfer protein n=1 Tax=Priestia sp. SB1 TaxID=3132359 RepID=UPI003182060D
MEPYNFKKTFNDPITIYSFGEYSLPFGIGLMRLIIYILVLGLMILFRGFFLAISGFMPGLNIVVFLGLPFVVSHFLLRRDPQGKKLHFYLYDLCVYFFTIYIPKKKFSNDEEVMYDTEKAVTFEDVIVNPKEEESDGEANEIENAYQNVEREFNANKVG